MSKNYIYFYLIFVMLKYICTKNVYFKILKNVNILKMNEIFLNFYKICIIY